MDFSLNEQQELLRDAARAFVDKEMALAPLLVPGATIESSHYAQNWEKLIELGWAGAVIPEEFGGVGMDEVDLSMIVSELGRGLGASPFVGNLFGTWALLEAGSPSQQLQLLPAVALGEVRRS